MQNPMVNLTVVSTGSQTSGYSNATLNNTHVNSSMASSWHSKLISQLSLPLSNRCMNLVEIT